MKDRTGRRTVLLSVAVATSLLVPPATSASGLPGDAVAPMGGVQRPAKLDRALERVQHAGDLVSTGGLADAVRAASDLPGVPLGNVRPVTPLTVPAVPVAIDEPVSDLLGAVQAATILARRSIRGPWGDLQRLQAQIEQLNQQVTARLGASLGEGRAVWGDLPARAARLEARVDRLVDRPALYAAAYVVAAAVDRALPALRGSSAPLVGAGAQSEAPCSLVDEPPALCVGGSGQSTYDSDYALLIDLGGDDLYTNSAGGADPGVPVDGTGGNGLPISVVLDLGGNERYEPSLAMGGARAVMGSAYYGGIGVLVDAAGADAYLAETAKPNVQVSAVGYGIGGAGIFADLQGDDSYAVRNLGYTVNHTGGIFIDYVGAAGFGVGSNGGLGIALERGAGSDTYSVRTEPVLATVDGTLEASNATAAGFGEGGAGVGIFADGGGTDSMEVRALSPPIPPDATGPFFPGSIANADGFGSAGLGGYGLFLSGPGNTNRTVEAVSRTTVGERVWTNPDVSTGGFGYGYLGGLGALRDEGGDDANVLQGTSTTVRSITIDDPCECPGQIEAVARTVGPQSFGMGVGALGGAGLLLDDDGNDVYDGAATSTAGVEVIDRREAVPAREGDGPSVVATADGGAASGSWQGEGVFGGIGFLSDLGGNDRYGARTRTEARATVQSPALAAANASTLRSLTYAQGVAVLNAYGELRDLGGTDAYTSSASGVATADPPSAVALGRVENYAQALADFGSAALFLDTADGGATDTFASVPDLPPCVGTRGGDVWVACLIPGVPGSAVGVNH